MNRISSVLLAATMVSAAHAGAAQAQVAITPLVGAYIPGSSFKDVRSGASTVAVQRDGTLAFGVNIETGFLRGSLAYATGTTIRNTSQEDIGEGDVLAAAADVVLRPLPRILVQPYVLGGVGVKNLTYDKDADVGINLFPENKRELALHAGVGADVSLGRIAIVAELTDFISRDADDKWNIHDAFLSAGLKLKL